MKNIRYRASADELHPYANADGKVPIVGETHLDTLVTVEYVDLQHRLFRRSICREIDQ